MPRTKLPVAHNLESLSILDEEGRLDREHEPELGEAMLLKLYRAMLLGRRFDERMLDLQRQGRIGTFPPIKGQEAAQLGAVAPLRPGDWLVPSFRETAAEIWHGRSLESVLLYYNGFNEGTHIEPGVNMLPLAVPVASQLLHAVGLGWAISYRKMDDVVLCFLGDGATSQGDFHEALNCAAVFQAPVVFVCQNNQWAISVPLALQTHSKTLVQKVLAYDIPGIQVDGNDLLAVYSAAAEAVERARSGGGPSLIECITYRIMMHTTADDPSRYRDEAEVEIWRRRDPILRYETYLKDKGLLDDGRRREFEEDIGRHIQKSVEQAEEQMQTLGEPSDMFSHLYAELPPALARQKDSLQQELRRIDQEAGRD